MANYVALCTFAWSPTGLGLYSLDLSLTLGLNYLKAAGLPLST